MANRTVKDAITIKGTNPQFLIEKIIRSRIYESQFWKEDCFALTSELLVDKAMKLRYIGGTFASNVKPCPFLCLTLKMLQIQPQKDIVIEFIKNEENKYVRALGAFYLRLTGTTMDCYKYLEPLLNDYRKIRTRKRDGTFALSHVDEFIDDLLQLNRVNDVVLPHIQKREILEESSQLEPRISILLAEDEVNELLREEAENEEREKRRLVEAEDDAEVQSSREKLDKESHHGNKSSQVGAGGSGRSITSHNTTDSTERSGRSRRNRRSRSRSPVEHHSRSSRSSKPSSSRHSKHHQRSLAASSSNSKDSLSVEESNKIRASLGLAPLK